MNHKSLNKKVRRLVARIEKDTKKLAKLRLKLSRPPQEKEARKKKTVASGKVRPGKKTAPPLPKRKVKRTLSPERRAQLRDAMNARWAAKRAAAASTASGVGQG